MGQRAGFGVLVFLYFACAQLHRRDDMRDSSMIVVTIDTIVRICVG